MTAIYLLQTSDVFEKIWNTPPPLSVPVACAKDLKGRPLAQTLFSKVHCFISNYSSFAKVFCVLPFLFRLWSEQPFIIHGLTPFSPKQSTQQSDSFQGRAMPASSFFESACKSQRHSSASWPLTWWPGKKAVPTHNPCSSLVHTNRCPTWITAQVCPGHVLALLITADMELVSMPDFKKEQQRRQSISSH